MSENAISPAGFPRVFLGGAPVDLCEKGDFLDLVRFRLRDHSSLTFVGSANLDHIHHFGASPESVREWLTLLDGEPLTWVATLLTRRAWPRLAGADLLDDLLRLAGETGVRVGFLGGHPEVHRRAGEVLRNRYPALIEPLFWSPTRSDLENPEICRKIAAEVRYQGVDMLFVCLGKPRQENWIGCYGRDCGATVQLAFGASVDFLAGAAPRAPTWMRSAGLEWAYRLCREPRRLSRRYLVQGPPAMLRLVLRSDGGCARRSWIRVPAQRVRL